MNSLNLSVPVRIEVPNFIRFYCENRYTEVIEYLDKDEYTKIFRRARTGEVKIVKAIAKESGLTKVLVRYKVKPLTVMKNPMLKRAAELEFMTYATNYPISLQEARYILIDEYPQTNCLNEPISCLLLIRENKGCFKLSLNETVKLAEERRQMKCSA